MNGTIMRHPVHTRLLHWGAAFFFVAALLSGFAIYSPWLFHWIAPVFGGGPMTRLLHPWFSLGFVVFFGLQTLNWREPMTWTDSDRRWMAGMREYVSGARKLEAEDVGFFNGGQKVYFWVTAASGAVFLLTGLAMWFPEAVGRGVVAVSFVIHDLAALAMLAGFIVHIYEATAAQPGTFGSMTRGSVTARWAWTHHPAWYRAVTGRDPRADYERARQRSAGRTAGTGTVGEVL